MAKKSAGEIAEDLLHNLYERVEAKRKEDGFKPRGDMVEERKRGAIKNWWGPKAYKVSYFLTPWQYMTLLDNAERAGVSIFRYMTDSCTNAELVPILKEAGLMRKKKIAEKAGKLLGLNRKRPEKPAASPAAPSIIATHYGLPRRAAARRVAHG